MTPRLTKGAKHYVAFLGGGSVLETKLPPLR